MNTVHTYTVGQAGVLVHNDCGDELAGGGKRTPSPNSKGKSGENQAREIEDIGEKAQFPSASKAKKHRIADGVTEASMNEVKNVLKLSKTKQILDYLEEAKANGKTFQLWVRKGTKISGPLQKAIDDGLIILRRELK